MALSSSTINEECPFCNEPVTDHPIQGSVGIGGNNIPGEVKFVQQFLNALSPLEGGPVEALKVDGIVGPMTSGAISKYQTNVLGWADGRIDPQGQTIKKLTGYIVDSPTIPYGPLGYSRAEQTTGGSSTPAPTPPADQAISIAVANICLKVMEPKINTLRWKLTRVTPAMRGLLNKHFAFKNDKVTNGDIAHVQKILAGIHHYLARFNAWGKLPVENVIVFDPVPTSKVIAWTVRGGDKMSTKQIQIYVDKGKVIKAPGQSIFLTNLFASQPREEKHWAMLHEFAHFTGARDGSFLAVTDYAGAGDAKFLTLPKFNRLHNAESLALFFLECIYGTYTVVNLPRLSLHRSHFDTFPKVSYDGSILASLADVLGRKGIGMETTL